MIAAWLLQFAGSPAASQDVSDGQTRVADTLQTPFVSLGQIRSLDNSSEGLCSGALISVCAPAACHLAIAAPAVSVPDHLTVRAGTRRWCCLQDTAGKPFYTKALPCPACRNARHVHKGWLGRGNGRALSHCLSGCMPSDSLPGAPTTGMTERCCCAGGTRRRPLPAWCPPAPALCVLRQQAPSWAMPDGPCAGRPLRARVRPAG